MKSVKLVLIFVAFLSAVSVVHAQGFRGSSRSWGSAGHGSSSGAASRQTFQRTPHHSGTSLQRPGVSIQQTWTHPAPTIKNPVHPKNSSFQPPPAFQHPPTLGRVPGRSGGKVRHHRHRPRHFHRHRGFFIVDVPRFNSTTVITQVAPGVVQAERRYADAPSSGVPRRGPDHVAPFDPTPQEVVERMLVLAGVKKGDVIYDLGSGDGRFLITAAKIYGVRGVGFEIDAGLVKLSLENARREGVEKLIEIRRQDFRTADLSPASVVTLYLSYDGNLAVREQLRSQLKPGARVVSYTFDMGDWPPKIAESYRDAAGDSHLLYLWEITASSLASRDADPVLQPHPTRDGPLIIEVR